MATLEPQASHRNGHGGGEVSMVEDIDGPGSAFDDEEPSFGSPSSSSSKGKGLARLPFVRKLVTRLVDSAVLDLSALDVKRPTSKEGLSVAVNLRVSDLSTGPLPLKAKLKFKGTTELCWPTDAHAPAKSSKKSRSRSRAGQVIALASLGDLKVTPSAPGVSSGATTLSLDHRIAAAGSVGDFARALIQAPVDQVFPVILRATNITVKAYGFTFSGLEMEKEVPLGGLGNLGDALRYPELGELGAPLLKTPSQTSSYEPRGFLARYRSKNFKVDSNGKTRRSGPATLTARNLDIVGGHPEQGIFITATVDLDIGQPSKGLPPMSVQTGELRFALCLPTGGTNNPYLQVGKLILADTCLRPGTNEVQANGVVRIPPNLPPDSREAKACGALFSSLLQNEPSKIVAMESDSIPLSDAPWMAKAFQGALIWATLPPLGDKARLLDGAQLKAENELSIHGSNSATSRSRSDSIGSQQQQHESDSTLVRATLRNSFGAAIHVRKLKVRACEEDGEDNQEAAELGRIVTPDKWEGVMLQPQDSVPVTLPFDLNEDPVVLIRLLRASARKEAIDLGESFNKVLDIADRRGSASSSGSKAVTKDFAPLLTQALSNLTVSAVITIEDVEIGGYKIPGGIDFTQRSLAITISGATAAWIVPRVGAPLVSELVAGGSIEVGAIDIRELTANGMVATASLKLSNFGPIAAEVSLEHGLAFVWADGERKGHTAALFFVNGPLQIRPGQVCEEVREVNIVPAHGQSSVDDFSAFVGDLLRKESTDWLLEAPSIRVTAGGSDFHPRLSKKIELRGFGNFPHMLAEDFDILGEEPLSPAVAAQLGLRNDAMSLSFKATIELPNRSHMSLFLAKLDAELLVDDMVIGQITLTDVVMTRGQSTRTRVKGFIYAVPDMERVGSLASDLLANKTVHLAVRGQSALIGRYPPRRGSVASTTGQRDSLHPVEWLDAALRHLNVPVAIRHGPHDVVQRIELESLTAAFPRQGEPLIEVGAILVKYEVPFPIDVTIEHVQADVTILLDGDVVGTGTAAESQVLEAQEKAGSRRRKDSRSDSEVEFATGTLKLALSSFEVRTKSDTFSRMIKEVFEADETDRVSLLGVAHVRVRTALGVLPCHVDLGQEHKLRIKGMRSLATSPTDYTGLQVVDGTPEKLKVTFDLFLNNPSKNVMFKLPDSGLSFAAFYRGAFVGRAYVGGANGPFSLTSGPCAFKNVEFYYYPKATEEKAVRQLPANFLSGKVTPLEIRGDDESTELEAMRPALSSLRLSFDLKPLVDRMLIASIEITLGAKVLTANAVECEFAISNPLLVPIDLTSLSFVARYKGKPFGTSSMTWPEGSALRVAPGTGPSKPGQAKGQCLVTLGQRLDQLVRAFLAERGQIYLQVDLVAGVEMGGYRIPLFEYTQERLPLNIRNLQGVSKLLWALPG